jgi:hypothetical protein
MPDLPLLIFPEPSLAERYKKPFPKPHPKYPSIQEQTQRITPKLIALQQAFNERRIEVLQGAAGVDPEQVIVIETIDSIDNFFNAVSKIEGFEWMGEIEVEDIEPDEEGRLYLVMTNQAALQQLLSLWEKIGKEEELNFIRGELRGFAKFREAFKYLKDIRRWGVNDRLNETGIFESWEFKLQNFQDEFIKFEIELWFRRNEQKRTQNLQEVRNLVTNLVFVKK